MKMKMITINIMIIDYHCVIEARWYSCSYKYTRFI